MKRILGNLSFNIFHQICACQEENILYDICDGALYKTLLESEDGDAFKRKEAMTFLLNTDGASLCKSSKLTLWPVYLVINELPINIRFSPENVILAGIY